MASFVDLQRTFRDLTPSELENPEVLASLNDHLIGTGLGWPELLSQHRVVILAEAGAGKTREMIEQAARLVDSGNFAFFLPLESLDRDPLTSLLSSEQESAFEIWKAGDNLPAWFFLDAVDELKLTEGKLERALMRFSKSINGCLHRAHVLISCRPNDWRPSLDLATIQDNLPVPTVIDEERFLDVLEQDNDTKSINKREPKSPPSNTVRTVILLPLSERQIRLFAENSGIDKASELLAEVDRQNAWTFARRPLDLGELIKTWAATGRLGTRLDQHEANITSKLKDDPSRRDRGVLSEVQAREGAERLALAMALSRTWTLLSPEQVPYPVRTEGALDPALILKNWTEQQRQTLLRRALFDPATYGRVRFHHRSVQEFLAAKRLKVLREKGMPTKAIFRLLFSERYGIKVIFPSMRAIAAWLAIWDEDVCSEVIRREPELLLKLGDPESLNVSVRRKLLHEVVSTYGHGSWRGLSIPIDEIRRLATPELASDVCELWKVGSENADVRELLIELIWQGPLPACAELALSAARNNTWDIYHRTAAIRALIACDKRDEVRNIVTEFITSVHTWPYEIVQGVASDVFPSFMSVFELIDVIKNFSALSEEASAGLGAELLNIVEMISPLSETAINLRDQVTELIWKGRIPKQNFYPISGRFDDAAPALALLCYRQLNEMPLNACPSLIRACVIASRFTDYEGIDEPKRKLNKYLRNNDALRAPVFWAEFAFIEEINPKQNEWQKLSQVEQGSLIGLLTESDRTWLEEALDNSHPSRSMMALYALVRLWRRRGEDKAELEALREILRGDLVLNAALIQWEKSEPQNEALVLMEQELKERKRERAEKEAKRLEEWKKWKNSLLADPAKAFSSENVNATVNSLYIWLTSLKQKQSRYNVWNKAEIARAFSPEVANLAERAFRELWRKITPELWSARPSDERNSTPISWIKGLCGISAESDLPGWATSLHSSEARTAAAYATVELNGFASFLKDVANAHPAIVDAVIGSELSTQISRGNENNYLPMLQNLTYADTSIKKLLSPRLLTTFSVIPQTFSNKTAPLWSHHLDQILHILVDTCSNNEREFILDECFQRYVSQPNGPLALVFLRWLFRFNMELGTKLLMQNLVSMTSDNALELFADLFGGRDIVFPEPENALERANALCKLVQSAYAYIRPENDQRHDGVFDPNKRDKAETARNFLLSALLNTSGVEAHNVIRTLAAESNFAHLSDRLIMLARQRAASDAEFTPYSDEDINALESCYEAPPTDQEGLFRVMMDRLEDIDHHLRHSDFTDRRTLMSIEDEVEMQRTLAWRLHSTANGAYIITREEEVADQKRTDIRLSAVHGDQKAVIEIKLADKRWSLTQLERSLVDQLLGQYLRHVTCRAGCLLLTYNGKKNYWEHPQTGEHMNFTRMVEYLNFQASGLEIKMQYAVRLNVFGLDLTDPLLSHATQKAI